MIKPKVIEVPEREVYSPDGEFIGHMNVYEFNDLRIQIAKEQVSGYFAIFEDRRINIRETGVVDAWPNGFFDHLDLQLRELIQLRYPKTSERWQDLYPNPRVLDPDGWDRTNYDYSWGEELISYKEYQRRISLSTCMNYKEPS